MARRPIAAIRSFMGVNIYHYSGPGYRLPWTAGRMAADTLAGIKQLIREDQGRA